MVKSRAFYFGLLAAVAAERLGELWLSRRNARRAFGRGARESGRRHFRAMAAVHSALLPACAAEVVLARRRFPGALGWAALAGVAAAQGLRYWAVASLGDRWNVRVIVTPGDAPIRRGPYRWARHPNYVAVALEVASLPLVHGAWMTAAVFSGLNAALLTTRIRIEEAALGAGYAEAFRETPRFGLGRAPHADARTA